jgi:PmbA protein
MQDTTSGIELLRVCEQTVDSARAAGADHAEVFATDLLDLEVNIQKNDLDQVATARESTFGVRVIRNGRQGFATANRECALAETVAEAIALARIAPQDPLVDIPDPSAETPTRSCIDPAFDEVQTDEMVELAMKLLCQTLAQDSRLTVDTAELSLSRSTSAIASSKGIARSWKGAGAGGGIFGMAIDGNEVGSFSYDGARVRQLSSLDEALTIAFDRFSQHALGALGATQGTSFRGPILLPPDCVAEFLIPKIIETASSREVRQGRSPLAGRIGEQVSKPGFSLLETGSGLDAFPLCPFDREGQSRAPRVLINEGVLQDFLYDSYEARAVGRSSTAHAQGGASSLPRIGAGSVEILAGKDELATLKNMECGVIVTRLSGSFNLASGDFSGVVKGGFLVEKGEARPIQETTIAGNIWTALSNISGISRQREVLYGTQAAPWIRIEDISVTAGQSS